MAEQVTISELELAESLLNDMVIPVETPTKTYSVTLKTLKKFIGTSLPLGCIVQNIGITDDERLTLLDGKTLSRAGTYKDFCDKVVEYVANGKWKQCTENEFQQDVNTYGQCGKFVITNDYVRIPKITRFLGGTVSLSEIGNTYAESLPNIRGKSSFTRTSGINEELPDGGAITWEVYNYDSVVMLKEGKGKADMIIDASRYSSSYKEGAKVQPDHTKYPYYMIVSSEGQVEPISVDINKVYEDLNMYQINHLVDNFNSPDSVTYPTTSAVDSRITEIMNSKSFVPNWGLRQNISPNFVSPSDGAVSILQNWWRGELYTTLKTPSGETIPYFIVSNNNSSAGQQSAGFILVRKGDTVISSGSSWQSAAFYPIGS